MEFELVLRKRRMVRSFKDKDVEDENIMKLLAHAHRAPSAGFLQQQEFIVIRDKDLKEQLAKAAVNQHFLAEAPVVIAVCSNTDRVVKRYGERGVNFYSVIDGSFASMLILLSAANEGLAACFVGAFVDKDVSEILKLPKHVKPIGLIGIGHANEPPEKFERMPLQKITYYERYGQKRKE